MAVIRCIKAQNTTIKTKQKNVLYFSLEKKVSKTATILQLSLCMYSLSKHLILKSLGQPRDSLFTTFCTLGTVWHGFLNM